MTNSPGESKQPRPVAVVTGASSGIGAEFARQFAARGYDVLLIARREDRLRAVAQEISTAHGISAEILVADLAADADRARAAARVAAAENLAVLVNNAGFGTLGSFEDADIAWQAQMHRLNILATLDLTHAALGNFKSQLKTELKKGTDNSVPLRESLTTPAQPRVDRAARHPFQPPTRGIINVSSVAGFEQAPFNVGYCATKAWINSFTKGLSLELIAEVAEGSPVKVQALCPGYTQSEFHDVMGIDRRTIPKVFWMTSQFVVSESLRGFDRGALFVIPGWHYRWIVRFIRVIPASWMRRISIAFARKRRARAQAFGRRA
ncbi:MAG TPA: SDR family NAD(P)-dependent oxidoreductase [Bryobacteraceae bacterium]|nr:SDR family NAD(P)-dependent oxidoreductase [Bryobacteraceae bacterium]